MPTYYTDSPYGMTRYVSGGNKTALTPDSLQLFSSFTQGGTIPFYIRYQFSWNYIETAKRVYKWGPLDETMDKIMGTPGLRMMLNIAYAPSWWRAIDSSGKWVGYGATGATLAGGSAMAEFAGLVATRYSNYHGQNLLKNKTLILQCGNEEFEYQADLASDVGGTVLAYTFNYFAQAIKAVEPKAYLITGALCALRHKNGAHMQQWIKNFWDYVPGTLSGGSEPPQAYPDAMETHYYTNNASIASGESPASDPTTTDNSDSYLNATKPNISGVVQLMQDIINLHNPATEVWCCESGFNMPNCSPNNHNDGPSDYAEHQSRYTQNMMANMQFQGAGKYMFYSCLDRGNDPRALSGQAMSDYTSYVVANPQWDGATAPVETLYTSVDTLKFQGTPGTRCLDQSFSIMNPLTSNKTWSISSDQSWLTAKTLPTNGKTGTKNANLTTGTLLPGQQITLYARADSTQAGLATETVLTGNLTVTIGGHTSTIAVELFVLPNAASPDLSSASAGAGANGPTFTMTVGGSTPANQTITFKNQDSYKARWWAFTTAHWFSIVETPNGVLNAGATKTLTIHMESSIVSQFPPGTYNEVLTISASPFPPTYTWNDSPPPATTQFITIMVKLVVNKASTPVLLLSTTSLYFTTVAS